MVPTFLLFLFMVGPERGAAYDLPCEDKGEQTVHAYENWPLQVDCEHLKAFWNDDPRKLVSDVFECEVEDESAVTSVADSIYLVENTAFTTKLIINNATCLFGRVDVRLQPVLNESCTDHNDRVYRDETIQFFSASFSKLFDLECKPPGGSPDVIPPNARKNDFRTTWTHNCNNALDEQPFSHLFGEEPKSLRVPGGDFYHVGNYTCEVEYNGTTLRVVTYSVCMKQSRLANPEPSIICTNQETQAVGETANFECKALVELGTVYGDIVAEWKTENGEVVCRSDTYGKIKNGLADPRHTCSIHGDNSSIVCETKLPTVVDQSIQSKTRSVDIQFNISNLKSEDFGKYTCTLYFKDKQDNDTVQLTEDLTPFYQRLIVILSSVLAAVLVVAVLVIIYLKYEIYFKICYKRSLLWKYDRDCRHFAAYLSYYFDEGMEEEARNRTTLIVGLIQEELKRHQYKMYDENMEPNIGNRIEIFANNLENSHRMIIVLTEDYFTDAERWMRFHADAAYHSALEEGLGLVFVTTPGAMKALERRARTDEVWARVRIAVRANPVIKWNEAMANDVFKRHIEYYMPKLRKAAEPAVAYNPNGDVALQIERL